MTFSTLSHIEVIPEEDLNEIDSPYSHSVRRMRKLLQSYEEKINISVPNYDDVHGKAILLAMGVKIGDQVMINDEKVSFGCETFYRPLWSIAPALLAVLSSTSYRSSE